MAIRKWGDILLIADALVGMPFPDSQREREIQHGPRGLGVVIGLMVDDLDATYAYCIVEGCEITCEPMNEAGTCGSSFVSTRSDTSGSSPSRSPEWCRRTGR